MSRNVPVLPSVLPLLLRYEPETGSLFWLPRTAEFVRGSEARAAIWNAAHAGRRAFLTVGSHGYPSGTILDRVYLAHRVIWAIVHGAWPLGEIDHIDGDRTNNRLLNLRCVPRTLNMRNRKLGRDNRSGIMGVYWAKHAGKWRAEIKADATRLHLGYFVDKAAAITARQVAERELGFHPNHGRTG